MSEYDETIDSVNRICPYCGGKYQPEGEDFSEDRREEECDYCNKKYWAYDSFTIDHWAEPDCELNDLNHQMDRVLMKNGHTHEFCIVCGKVGDK